jgi:hypothetical protein
MPKAAAAERREAHRTLDELDGPRLRAACEFLGYLRLRELEDPTLELLGDSKMMRDIRAAREDLRAGRTSKFTSFAKLRRDV